jgi:hypothetical protein
MQKPIVIQGRSLTLTGGLPATLTFTLGVTTDVPALRTIGKGAAPVLINSILVNVSASGNFVTGTSTFVGNGSASIVASTPRVTCEGQQMLTEGDSVVVTCTGTITTTSSGVTTPGTATVEVVITDGVQKNVNANKA